MGKQIIQDLATVLTEKNGLPKADAQRFVTAVFDVIQDGLDRDKLVKLKGLGTFKVVDVEARESVNVNTGERVVIDSHSKISFIPDATMRELVNKPFSGFETVVLNEGVVFDDMDADGRELADEETAAEETVADETPSISSISETENTLQPVESTHQVEESTSQPIESTSQPVESKAQTVESNPQVEDEKEEEPQSCGWGKWLLLTLIACSLCFGGGFWLGQHQAPVTITDTDSLSLASDSLSSASDSLSLASDSLSSVADSLSLASDSLSTVSDSKAALADTLSKEPVAEQKAEPIADMTDEEKWAISIEKENQKYEAMDSRIRTGAYYIVGTKEVVTVREGDTMSKIARRSVGPELICYIEAYNGLKANEELVVGQKIKIPDLKWKKNIRNYKRKN